MDKVLILYPEIFNSYDKFKRKVLNITKNMVHFSIQCRADPNDFIKKLTSNELIGVKTEKVFNLNESKTTHAIIFDDGEEFLEERKLLQLNKIPLREIHIKLTRVINIKKKTKYQSLKSTPEYEYIGRNSYWGNPYSMFEKGEDRDEVIRKYKYDFDYEKFPNKEKSKVYKLAGKRLGCFCKPQACHGDILADFLNSWDDGK